MQGRAENEGAAAGQKAGVHPKAHRRVYGIRVVKNGLQRTEDVDCGQMVDGVTCLNLTR